MEGRGLTAIHNSSRRSDNINTNTTTEKSSAVGLCSLFHDGQLSSEEVKGFYTAAPLSLVEDDVDYSALIAAELEEEEKYHKLKVFEQVTTPVLQHSNK